MYIHLEARAHSGRGSAELLSANFKLAAMGKDGRRKLNFWKVNSSVVCRKRSIPSTGSCPGCPLSKMSEFCAFARSPSMTGGVRGWMQQGAGQKLER